MKNITKLSLIVFASLIIGFLIGYSMNDYRQEIKDLNTDIRAARNAHIFCVEQLEKCLNQNK